jgi:hypothetical protein
MDEILSQIKSTISSIYVTVGAPIGGSLIGILSFFEKITPLLTVVSLLTGIILGILSFRLKRRKILKELENEED